MASRGVRALKRPLKACAAAGVAVGAAVVLALSGPAQAASTPGWRFAAVYPQSDGTWSVSASGAANAWAVGQQYSSSCDMCLFTAHWNGGKWQTIPAPAALRHQVNAIVGFAAVAATAGERAWIFAWGGEAELGTSELSAVEWTGTSWSAVHNFPGSPSLTAAAASGPGDVWGFGVTGSRGQTPWAVHYNGKRWSQVAIPVNVTEASGSAAAGDWVTGTSAAQPARIEVLRWSTGAWRNVPLPKISVPEGEQMQPGYIAAVSPTSVWASVVAASPTVEGRVTYVLLHWNGRAWSKVPLPKGVNVYGLAGDGHGGAWVASYKVNEPGVYLAGLAMYHYAGGRWTRDAVPVLRGLDTNLQSGNMELIPGTRSVLASATMFGSASIEGGILKYGP
jgi:hypothetical protein